MSLVQNLKGGVFAGVAAVERVANSGGGPRNRPLREISNFLLLQYPSALGTAIHATPLIQALRHAVPQCRIVVAASGFALDVFRNNPGIDRLIETPNPLKDLNGSVKTLRRELPFNGAAFATLTSTGNERTRIAMQALLSGASIRVGFTVVPKLYRRPLFFNRSLSQIANNLRIVEALEHTPSHFEPEIFYREEDRAFARETLARAGVQSDQPVAVFVTQTSVTQRKSWRPERFKAAAEFLTARYGAHIVFVGTTAESAAIDELRGTLSAPSTSVAGKTTLPQLAALMSLATVGLTLDTGPMHLGRAVGLPMVIIAPAWSPPIEWLPLGNDKFRIFKNADIPVPPPADYIIDEVSVDEVTSALADLLTLYPKRNS
ncbi:glycosyltransferase family 9 protein [Edaphobacter dinghuensis]|uniref:ADP-heptose--LPS heptosyltransferase n=1 Tax=Edaphobacter dinghuensis TaxID=1560005 RepID=A0A917HBJ7_9BACT|nr:glycosyltransferase family 9 protein [Edaphobacter dinghuensis]GGG73976.1 ADP-heptose--LPS heptosyltransferase [Edaphobacter dinghuensis]